MARKPTVRYFPSREAYYCQMNGRQHRLADGPDDAPAGPTYLKALEAFRQLFTLGSVQTARDRNTVRAVLETYCQHQQGKLQSSSLARRLDSFRPFCAAHGETAVGDLTPLKIEAFCLDMRKPRKVKGRVFKWGDGATGIFLDGMSAAFRWALRKKLITVNPFEGIDRPSRRSRSRETVLSPEQHGLVLARCSSRHLKELIVALENTGCRIGELTHATARDWNDALGALVYYGDDRRRQDEFRHKTASRKDRTIRFTGQALVMMRQLVSLHPAGPLFRTRTGKPWATTSVAHEFNMLGKRVGLPLMCVSYRHTFATRWLTAGRSIDVLAELLGNTANTIRKHYAHLCTDAGEIRRQLEEFKTEVESEK